MNHESNPIAKRFLLLVLLSLLLRPAAAGADVVTLAPTKDTTLYGEDASKSNGAGDNFFAGHTNNGSKRRGLVAFNVAGSIPAGATINSVTLTLRMSRTQAGSASVSVHRLLQDWGEGTSDAGGQEGTGANATTNDATWLYRFYNTSNPPGSPAWTTAGGSFNATASATTTVGGNGFYNWSSAAMAADVQAWLNTPGANFGWIVIGTEAGVQTAKRFDSRDHNTVANRPVLSVNFTPSSPTGACCATDGMCSVVPDPGSSCTGTYQGSGTVCSPNPCPQPTGACCFPDASATCTQVTQTSCAGSGGTFQGSSTSCSPNPCPVVLTPFVDALPLPAVAQPVSGSPGGAASYQMSVREVAQRLHRDLPLTTVWGIGDGPTGAGYPGPTIEAASDQPVTVTWINDLRDLTTGLLRTQHYLPVDSCLHGAETDDARVVFHVHGAHVEAASDGYPEDTLLPGQQDVYQYSNHQLPSTLWYHDHALGITRLNVMMGLAGFYLLRDPIEQALNLPTGEYEIPLAIQDRTFNPDGSLHYHATWEEHFFGDKIVVNGKVWPYLDVKKGKYRFRMLNGSTSRTYTLALSNGATFQQIGAEGGLLPAPVTMTQVTLGPGERADVIMDFAPYATGTQITLTNSAPAPFPGTPGVGVIPDVMRFVVQAQAGDTDPVPAMLRPIEHLQEGDAVVTRTFDLAKGTDPCTGAIWLINGMHWDDITEYPELGTTEIWKFVNRSGVTHPMHLHLVMFQVLDRQAFNVVDGQIVPIGSPVPPPAHEAGWKDTVQVGPNEIVRLIARFEDYAGKFPYHCHILEHEDHEMMRQFQSIQCGNGAIEPTEECDDANSSGADGCSAGCDAEELVQLQGTAQGGGVDVTVSGVLISVATTPGQTAAQVVQALASAINANSALAAMGVTASSMGNVLGTTGTIDALMITDPGLQEFVIPTLGAAGAAALAALLGLGALRLIRRRRKGIASASLVIAVLMGGGDAWGGTAFIPALKDNTLIESPTGALSNGAGPFFFAGRTSQEANSIRRGAIAFDVAAYVPPASTVTGVTLTLRLSQTNAGPAPVRLHRLLADWGEGTSSASGGSGAPAAPGDATWLHTFHDTAYWVAAGGDFASVPSASFLVDQPGACTWGPTEALVADVQAWLDHPETNAGWILLGDETAPSTSMRFDSRESPETATPPVLVVEFERGRRRSCDDGSLTRAAKGLCAAYCEALDCDGTAPRGSARACEQLEAKFRKATDGLPLPCAANDADGDGILDDQDNCPDAPNLDQADGDGDAAGDACDNCPLDPNADQSDTFGEAGVGDACDCPCFTERDVVDLIELLGDEGTFEDLRCSDERPESKTLAAVSAVRVDGEPCGTASMDCSAIAVEFTEDNVCQLNPPAPAAPTNAQGITARQLEACRRALLDAAAASGLACD
jgi:spore coat protein A